MNKPTHESKSIIHETEHLIINLSVTPNRYLGKTQIFIAIFNKTDRDMHIKIKSFDRALYKYFSFLDALIFRFSAPDSFQYNIKSLKFLVRPALPHFTTDIYFVVNPGQWGGFFVFTKLVEFDERRAEKFLNSLLNSIEYSHNPPPAVARVVGNVAAGVGEVIGSLIGKTIEGTARGLINPAVITMVILILAVILLKKKGVI